MRGINLARVVLGGLLAGLVINIGEFVFNGVLFAADLEAAMAQLNLPPVGPRAIAVFVISGFVLGMLMVWLYAAIRTRFGPGAGTALCAGSTVWFLAYLYPSIGYAALGIFPTRLLAIGVVWGLVELLLASVAGARVYQEPTTASSHRANV
jgi:hypothetical protein